MPSCFYLQVMYGPKSIGDLVDTDTVIKSIMEGAGGEEVGHGYFMTMGLRDIEFKFTDAPYVGNLIVQLRHKIPDMRRVVMFRTDNGVGRGECIYRWGDDEILLPE